MASGNFSRFSRSTLLRLRTRSQSGAARAAAAAATAALRAAGFAAGGRLTVSDMSELFSWVPVGSRSQIAKRFDLLDDLANAFVEALDVRVDDDLGAKWFF